MEKKFSKIEIAILKRTANNVATFVNKKEKLVAKIANVETEVMEAAKKRIADRTKKLEEEKKSLQTIIDSFQGPIKEMTGGYTTEDLVTREVVGTGKIDSATGKEIMQTRYVLKYPETVIPCETPVCGEETIVPEPAMPEAGNDFDVDAGNDFFETVEEPQDSDPFEDSWK